MQAGLTLSCFKTPCSAHPPSVLGECPALGANLELIRKVHIQHQQWSDSLRLTPLQVVFIFLNAQLHIWNLNKIALIISILKELFIQKFTFAKYLLTQDVVCFFIRTDMEKCSIAFTCSAVNGFYQLSELCSDGTHSPKRIHLWANYVMLNV